MKTVDLSVLKEGQMNNMQTAEKLLTAKAVGEMLGLSKRQVFRLKSSGKIPAPVKVGGSIRWVESEMSAWIIAGAPDRRTWNSMKGDGRLL